MNNNPAILSLRQRLRFLAKDSLLYGGAASFNKAFALLTFPILARHFSVEEYGIYDFVSVSISLLSTILIFGQDSAVARFFYEHNDTSTRKRIISQSFVFRAISTLVALCILWLGTGPLTQIIGRPQIDTNLIHLILLQLPFMGLINFSQNILKWTFRRRAFLTISIGSTICSISALLITLCYFDVGIHDVFSIFLVTRAIFGVLGFLFCKQWLVWPKEWRFLWPMFQFAAPLGLICIIQAFIPAVERTYIVKFLEASDLGLYAAGAKIAMLMTVASQAFQMAWGPFSLAIHKEKDAHITYSQVLKGVTLGMIIMVMTLSTIAEPLIVLLASSTYSGASIIVFPVAMGLGFQTIAGIVSLGITISKKSYLKLVSYGTSLFVSVIAIFIFMRAFGLVGVAWGAMLGRLSMLVCESWLSCKAYPLPWQFKKVGLYVGAAILWGIASHVVIAYGGILYGIAFFSAGLFLCLPVGLLTMFSKTERQMFYSWLSGKQRLFQLTGFNNNKH